VAAICGDDLSRRPKWPDCTFASTVELTDFPRGGRCTARRM